MRILLVIDQFDDDNNGTTMTARRLFDTLIKHGHQVRVVSTGRNEEYKYRVPEYQLIPVVKQIIKGQGMTIAKPKEEVLAEAVKWAELVHFVMPFFISMKGLAIAEKEGVPHTAAFHVQPENITYTLGLGRVKWINDMIYKYFNRHFYSAFSHIHCPSRFIASQLKEHDYQAKLHVISNGVNPDFVYRKHSKTKELEGKFVILTIGRLSNEKRQDLLIEAVKKSRYSDKIQLILAGQGLKKHKYEKMGKELCHRPIIRFYSHDELLHILAMSDLYVHAADAEIEAIACIEALSSGLVPVIADSPKSATPQFALDERSLFKAGSSNSLAQKIDYWIEHETERKEAEHIYSESGRCYSLDYCVEEMEKMFQEAMSDKGRQ